MGKPHYRITIVPDSGCFGYELSHFTLHFWGATLGRKDLLHHRIRYGIAGYATCIGYEPKSLNF